MIKYADEYFVDLFNSGLKDQFPLLYIEGFSIDSDIRPRFESPDGIVLVFANIYLPNIISFIFDNVDEQYRMDDDRIKILLQRTDLILADLIDYIFRRDVSWNLRNVVASSLGYSIQDVKICSSLKELKAKGRRMNQLEYQLLEWFGFTIPDNVLSNFKTVADIRKYLVARYDC